jgi:hypothetical protein
LDWRIIWDIGLEYWRVWGEIAGLVIGLGLEIFEESIDDI